MRVHNPRFPTPPPPWDAPALDRLNLQASPLSCSDADNLVLFALYLATTGLDLRTHPGGRAVTDAVRPLQPRTGDKLIHDGEGDTTISNDGSTIMKLAHIVHAAAKVLVSSGTSRSAPIS